MRNKKLALLYAVLSTIGVSILIFLIINFKYILRPIVIVFVFMALVYAFYNAFKYK